MARPKDKRPLIENERFLSRCAKEEDRLRLHLSTQLKQDMDRLFETGLHSDITLKSGFQEIKLHKFILKTRSLEIYNRLHEVCTEAGGDLLVLPEWVQVPTLRENLRLLYSTLTIQPLLSEDSDNDIGIVQDVVALLTFREKPQPEEEEEDAENDATEETTGSNTVDTLSDADKLESDDKNNHDNVNGTENLEECFDQTEPEQPTCNTSVEPRPTDLSLNENGEVAGACSAVNHEEAVSVESETEQKERKTNGFSDGKGDNSSNGEGDIVHVKMVENGSDECKESVPDDEKNSSKGDNCSLQDLIKMTYDLSIPYKACDSLGEGLLRGYLKEVDHDCVISISGAHFRAHKCILAIRCEYFAAMLGGSWMESDAQEICLESISPPVMEQVLLYLYGGVLDLEPCCPIGEVVMVSDMYGLQGLNTIVTYNLKKTYCHFFHKPCSVCETGVVETLTSALTFNLCDLRDKCIDWINTNMVKVWRTKAFATLPPEVLDMVCNSAIQHLSIQCVMEVMLDCQKLNRNIPRLKWCEPALSAVIRLMDSSIEYTAKNFISLLNSGKLRDIDTTLAYQMGLLEEIFGTVISSLPLSGACQVFERLHALNKASTSEEMESVWSEEFCAFIRSLYKMCEEFMKLHIHQMALTKDWDILNKDLQAHLMKNSSFVVLDMSVKEKKMGPRFMRMQKKKTEVKEQKTTLKARPVLTSDRTRKLSGSSTGTKSTDGGSEKSVGKSSLQSQNKTGTTRTTTTRSTPGKTTSRTGVRTSHSSTRAPGTRHTQERSVNPTCSDGKHCESSAKGNNSESVDFKGKNESQSGVNDGEDNDGHDRVCLPGQSFFGGSEENEGSNTLLNAEGQGSGSSLNAEDHGSATSLNAGGQGSATSLNAGGHGSATSLNAEGQGSMTSLNAEGQGGACQGQCRPECESHREALDPTTCHTGHSSHLPDPIVFNVELIPIFNISFFYSNAC
ncbi:uncharacterized protein LOC110455842 [Mizuhopecten yessoensis]|uniref:uncharacterized protein LOC110455842 n=1 Tax=Mizuhopecten yessoensis TaxID=6573 RepID=UPI000B459771|nr:uncharacterized protein LOC110455842 [Mizuhopecten yessoensis]